MARIVNPAKVRVNVIHVSAKANVTGVKVRGTAASVIYRSVSLITKYEQGTVGYIAEFTGREI